MILILYLGIAYSQSVGGESIMLQWPVASEECNILFGFGPVKANETGSYALSRGVTIQCPPNTSVLAADDGTVKVIADKFVDSPHFHAASDFRLIVIRHDNGLFSKYFNVFPIDLAVGQVVKRGQVVGNALYYPKFDAPEEYSYA